jgi:hypothetical protein
MDASIFFTAAMIRAFRSAVKNIDAPMLTRVWQELEYRIDVCCNEPCLKAAVKNIDAPMLTRVWQELEYRIDVCCNDLCLKAAVKNIDCTHVDACVARA